jgi:hypothetical protein
MTIKDQQQPQYQQCEEEITVETPYPEEIEPPQEAIVGTPIETNIVAVPVVVEEVSINTSATRQQQRRETCSVIAPATLQAGYTFPAKVDGIEFTVVVPEGGVQEGQIFEVPYPTNNQQQGMDPLSVEPMAPRPDEVRGKWRNPLCECCEVCPNGMCCFGWFCHPLMLAQVMTRLKLNPFGSQSDLNHYHQTFWWVLTFWVVLLLLLLVFIKRVGI